MLKDKESIKQEISPSDAVNTLKNVLGKHTGLSKKLAKSIICTFVEEMTMGHSAMVTDTNHGCINAVVHYLPEN